jgi:hypothetical protein
VTRHLALLLVSVLALSACRLDVTVDVAMEPDGTGVVTVEAIADAELVAQVPGLADDLRLEDAIANGWEVAGPIESADGGLSLTLTHGFTSHVELANVLNSIGPPFTGMAAARTTADEQTTNAIDGELVLADGFESFADTDLLDAVGGMPFGDEFAAMGTTPSESMSFVFRVSLPGELISAETGTEVDGGVIEWTAPLDGTALNVRTATVQRPADEGGAWAAPVSTTAFIALIVWVAVAVAFIAFVAFARGNKRRKREHALRNLR